MFIKYEIKHKCFQQNKQILLVYTQTVKEFLQLLRNPFDIGRSAEHKEVSAFMHNW